MPRTSQGEIKQHRGNKMHLSVYRATMKLLSLQKLFHMDVISVGHVTEAVNKVTRAEQHHPDMALNTEEVSRALNKMFDGVSQLSETAQEEICSLIFRLYDRSLTGCVPAASFQRFLIALSADDLVEKYRAFVSVLKNSSESVSRSGLRSLLQDLSQVPAAVQEEVVFGSVEAALSECCNGAATPTVSEENVLSWLQSSPRLLLWLPTLHRLSFSQNISHPVRCHTCKTFPITGLRYRCIKCVNVQVCQSCFLTSRHTRKHKSHHPVQEFCTQPTWREFLSSVVASARYALLPRRHTRRRADKRAVLMRLDSNETTGANPADISTQLADMTIHHRPDPKTDVSQHSSFCSSSSIAVQTDDKISTEQADPTALVHEVQILHEDKLMFEQDLQAWRLTVQSEHGMLQDRCSEMEVAMETIKQHHLCMQSMLTQALNKMEFQQHVDMLHSMDKENPHHTTSMPHSEEEESDNASLNIQPTETENATHDSDSQGNNEDDQEGQATPSPRTEGIIPLSHYLQYQEDPADENSFCNPTEDESPPEVAGLQKDERLHEEDTNNGLFGAERQLQEITNRLKSVMETQKWRERLKSARNKAELFEAADQVGASIHNLVEAVNR